MLGVFVGHPADLLSVVLSVYMYENGANIQLPEAGEVLLCNSSTTAEDVSQFLRVLFVVYYIIILFIAWKYDIIIVFRASVRPSIQL